MKKKKTSLTAPQRLVAAQLQHQKWDFNRRWTMKEEWSKQITAALTPGPWQHRLTPNAPQTKEGNSCFFPVTLPMSHLSLHCSTVTCQNTIWVAFRNIHTCCQSTWWERFNNLLKGTNQVSEKGSLHSYEPGAHTRIRIRNLNNVKEKELKLELKLLASISGKWLNPHICGRSPLFAAYLPAFIPAQWRLPIIGLSQRLERRRKSHRWRFKGSREQGGSKQEQRGVQRSCFCSCRGVQRRDIAELFFLSLFCFLAWFKLGKMKTNKQKKTITSRGLNSHCRKVNF